MKEDPWETLSTFPYKEVIYWTKIIINILIVKCDFLDITNASIAAECWFFFFAGFEASALVVSSTLLELARHSDIQTKLRHEIDTVLEKYNGEITYDSLQEMTYMEKVVYGKMK